MAVVLNWRQFFLAPERGGGSLSCAVTGKSDGRVCGLLRVGTRGDTTIVMRSDKMGDPMKVQAIHCSPSGCETAEPMQPVSGRMNRYRIPTSGGERPRRSPMTIDVNRPSESRLTVVLNDGVSEEPHVLQYHADRNLVTMGSEPTQASLMRGGSKVRIGRSHGYGMFAVEDIKAGEIVEEAPILSQATPFLADYTFASSGKHLLPLGNIALYNHSDKPSCAHTIDDQGTVMTLTATRDVKAGEEVSISYGGEIWFASRGMQPQSIG